jgi:hypothetical protein
MSQSVDHWRWTVDVVRCCSTPETVLDSTGGGRFEPIGSEEAGPRILLQAENKMMLVHDVRLATGSSTSDAKAEVEAVLGRGCTAGVGSRMFRFEKKMMMNGHGQRADRRASQNAWDGAASIRPTLSRLEST